MPLQYVQHYADELTGHTTALTRTQFGHDPDLPLRMAELNNNSTNEAFELSFCVEDASHPQERKITYTPLSDLGISIPSADEIASGDPGPEFVASQGILRANNFAGTPFFKSPWQVSASETAQYFLFIEQTGGAAVSWLYPQGFGPYFDTSGYVRTDVRLCLLKLETNSRVFLVASKRMTGFSSALGEEINFYSRLDAEASTLHIFAQPWDGGLFRLPVKHYTSTIDCTPGSEGIGDPAFIGDISPPNGDPDWFQTYDPNTADHYNIRTAPSFYMNTSWDTGTQSQLSYYNTQPVVPVDSWTQEKILYMGDENVATQTVVGSSPYLITNIASSSYNLVGARSPVQAESLTPPYESDYVVRAFLQANLFMANTATAIPNMRPVVITDPQGNAHVAWRRWDAAEKKLKYGGFLVKTPGAVTSLAWTDAPAIEGTTPASGAVSGVHKHATQPDTWVFTVQSGIANADGSADIFYYAFSFTTDDIASLGVSSIELIETASYHRPSTVGLTEDELNQVYYDLALWRRQYDVGTTNSTVVSGEGLGYLVPSRPEGMSWNDYWNLSYPYYYVVWGEFNTSISGELKSTAPYFARSKRS